MSHDQISADLQTENQRLRAELLALRGGKVGPQDLGGSEAKADGEPRPTSAPDRWWKCPNCNYEFSDRYAANAAYGCCPNPGCLTVGSEFESIPGPHSDPPATATQSASGAPSPEPAAIPKTTKVREWWLSRPKAHVGSPWAVTTSIPQSSDRMPEYEVVRVREVGEGRKVSAEAMEWMKAEACNPHASAWAVESLHELLCVLSEEGGRQKEGGTEITSGGKSSEL